MESEASAWLVMSESKRPLSQPKSLLIIPGWYPLVCSCAGVQAVQAETMEDAVTLLQYLRLTAKWLIPFFL